MTLPQIGIIGLGLIGGSLALALHNKNYSVKAIVPRTQLLSIKSSFSLSSNLSDLKDCDLIFICTPLKVIPQILKELAACLPANCLVSDVGSLKQDICQLALDLPCNFIGGHPMAGTEKKGFEHALPDLFSGKPWALMKSSEAKSDLLVSTIQSIGAKIVWTEPVSHDRAVALVSHFPLLLSLGLEQTLINLKDPNLKELAEQLASSGFASMTRLAKGNPELNQNLLELSHQEISSIWIEFNQEIKYILQKEKAK